MKSFIILSIAAVIVSSCLTKTETVEVKIPPPEKEPVVLIEQGCYGFSDENSSIRFQIVTATEQNVEGRLYYALAEKDANNGAFKGVMNGDTLIGMYTFTSEGIESTRQVAFLLKNKSLVEGFGAMDSSGTKFLDVHELEYSSTMPLTKISCED